MRISKLSVYSYKKKKDKMCIYICIHIYKTTKKGKKKLNKKVAKVNLIFLEMSQIGIACRISEF